MGSVKVCVFWAWDFAGSGRRAEGFGFLSQGSLKLVLQISSHQYLILLSECVGHILRNSATPKTLGTQTLPPQATDSQKPYPPKTQRP